MQSNTDMHNGIRTNSEIEHVVMVPGQRHFVHFTYEIIYKL
jgi:hypothetical protein